MAKQLTKQAKLEMFAMLESVVTDEGWNRVKVAHSGFTEAEKYPLELLKILNMKCTMYLTTKQYRNRYHKINMGPMRATKSLADRVRYGGYMCEFLL
jgi:hypothetical protein